MLSTLYVLHSTFQPARTPTPTPTPGPSTYGALRWDDPLVQGLVTIIRALVVFAIALVIARLVRTWTVRLLTRGRMSLNLATLLGNVMQVIVVVCGLVFVLPSFGVDWTGLLTLVGAAGLALSLSMQDLLKNVIAGIYILMEQPFRIGDRISVKEVTGTVQSIELRTTVLCTDEDLQVVVPNSTVLNEIVINRSVSNLRKQILLVEAAVGDVSDMSGQITRVLRGFEGVVTTPAPVVALEQVKDGVARLRVEFWALETVRHDLTAEVAKALQAAFPQAALTVV